MWPPGGGAGALCKGGCLALLRAEITELPEAPWLPVAQAMELTDWRFSLSPGTQVRGVGLGHSKLPFLTWGIVNSLQIKLEEKTFFFQFSDM